MAGYWRPASPDVRHASCGCLGWAGVRPSTESPEVRASPSVQKSREGVLKSVALLASNEQSDERCPMSSGEYRISVLSTGIAGQGQLKCKDSAAAVRVVAKQGRVTESAQVGR